MATSTLPSHRPHRIGLGQAVALYVGAVLGAGVLVLPGQAASLAGPASLVAWLFVGLLGLPLATTFAALATEHPGAGGVATYAARAFGPYAGGLAGWLYFVAVVLGHVIVPLTGGYYIAAALRQGTGFAFAAAGAILLTATVTNLVGLRLSGRLQLLLAGGVAVLLLVVTAAALPHLEPDAFVPFAPHGISGIGRAAVILFFAFAGWEAIVHLTGEFRDVRRDLMRATKITVGIVLLLYFGVALAVVSTGSYGSPGMDRTAVGTVLGGSLGFSAAASAGVLATVICLGTTNAFMASVSRLGCALADDGWMPAAMARRSTRGAVPVISVLVVAGLGAVGLVSSYVFGWGTEDLVGLPSALVIITYLLGTAAGVKLLRGRQRIFAALALLMTAVVTPFAAGAIVVPVIVAALALLYRRFRSAR